jgi:hypothetical protein
MIRMIRLVLAAAAATVAAAFTLVLAGPAHADAGEIILDQANGQRVLSTSVESVDNTTTPITIAATETPGATTLNVYNRTNESIKVAADGRSATVGPLQTASLPETGSGLIILAIPAGT